jgi:hypothetical protein
LRLTNLSPMTSTTAPTVAVNRVAHLPVLEDHDERERVRTTTTYSTDVLRGQRSTDRGGAGG